MSNKPYYRSAITCIAATIAALSGPLSASEVGLEEIIVTAQKRSENLQDVASGMTAIGAEKLDQLQVNEFQDYVKFLPSVTIQSTAPGFSQVYFRGVASGENANHSASLPTVGV